MNLEIIPAHDLPLAAQAATFTEAFEGYVGGSFAMDAAGLARFLRVQGADLCYSCLARNAAGLCGFGYITRVGEIARLAGMGVIATARRTGVARGLLLHLLEEARARRDRMMVLEVIEQNPAAWRSIGGKAFAKWGDYAVGVVRRRKASRQLPARPARSRKFRLRPPASSRAHRNSRNFPGRFAGTPLPG
ncbi:MAG: GNAT family N-acetyltransferase [Verrucomicrobiota bacterium]|nr:GNAT family N-acetyltransferase [Verrucomicrobiota bacterium]